MYFYGSNFWDSALDIPQGVAALGGRVYDLIYRFLPTIDAENIKYASFDQLPNDDESWAKQAAPPQAISAVFRMRRLHGKGAMQKRHILTADDKAFWQHVVRDVQPLSHAATPPLVATKPLEETGTLAAKVATALSRTRVLPDMSIQKPCPPPSLEPRNRIGLDRRTAQRFERGKMVLDGRLDLHGLNRESAYVSFRNFLLQHVVRGNRCLLIITGKGSKGKSVLRQSLPLWLNEPDLRPLILSYSSAHIKDGGEGAFYILLKKKRKNSKY